MKTCIRCHLLKPLDDFGNYSRYPDGKHRYCRTCWNRLINEKRHAKGAKPVLPFLERLWSHVQQCGHEDACPYCCWPWLSTKDEDGYGRFAVTYKRKHLTLVATHVLYEVWHARRVPKGTLVCHHCDNPSCGNPLHLWLGTFDDNRQDCIRKDRHAKGLAAGVNTKPEAFPRGEQRSSAKLKEDQVLKIRAAYATGTITAQALADTYGVSKPTILSVIHRRIWFHI